MKHEPKPLVSEDHEELDEESYARLFNFNATGPSLRDELASLVDEDPEMAANILKNWIGHVE